MKIVCEGIELSDALGKVVKACSTRTTNPILETVKLSAENDGLSLLATDGEISIWSALLCSEEEYSQQDLAEMLFLPKQTVNSIISNLTKKGFVFLEHVPGTRNRKVVRLTKEGQEYGQSRVMWIFRAEETAMEETDTQEVQAYISMLEKYISRLKDEINKKS